MTEAVLSVGIDEVVIAPANERRLALVVQNFEGQVVVLYGDRSRALSAGDALEIGDGRVQWLGAVSARRVQGRGDVGIVEESKP